MLLSKLRTIHLFKADFSWCQGLIIGRQMIKEAESKDRLHDSQWGTHPGRQAIGAVTLKVMSYQILRLTRTPLGSFNMDATSCFDRIIIALAMFLCRHQGVRVDPTLCTIKHKSAFKAHRTLGVWPTPSGDNLIQFQNCLDCSNCVAKGVWLNSMGRNEALMGYRHIWLPSVGYPLAAWGLHDKQLHQVEKHAVNAFLPKMGFSCKLSRNVIFGSRRHGGFGLTRLADYQGVNQTILFVQHLRLYDSICTLLHIGYSWYQLFCGVSFEMLGSPSIAVLHSPGSWFC
jgi:hypothetical protein